MDLQILYKWVTPMENPPSIINSMICMGMLTEDKQGVFGAAVPHWLMLLTVLTIPVMLIPKPLVLRARAMARNQRRVPSSARNIELNPVPRMTQRPRHYVQCTDHEREEEAKEDEEFEFGEVVIHQVIETIEFAIGTVSHVASYLRLWALSLAHQQLSDVFLKMTVLSQASSWSFPWNGLAVFLVFPVWFMITLLVLMGMDVLECFLHVLRLHWVEFQSKFYKADGYLFVPYNHRDLLTVSDCL
eukprot:NODE_5984_length_1715_cov_6.252519.p2 GENE.NODE_5984_length_1715_cov_6.252519~~NODE_5984_length_1715_cov_6.252519.p2  ORF type:complete len:244 (+),score=75.92 NODE_5984_length_1715_cov_6.252519:656-1387(+)